MFSLATILGLVRLIYASYGKSGQYTEEYRALWIALKEAFYHSMPDPTPPPVSPAVTVYVHFEGMTWEEVNMGQTIGKLDAVKEYKHRTGKGLMDSKIFVEKFFENRSLKFK